MPNTDTQGVALVERLRSCARELPIRAPAASNYHEAADRIEALAHENAELQAKVERLERENETYRTAFDGIEPAAQEGREAVAYRWREHYNAGREDRWHLETALPKFDYDVEVQPLFPHPAPAQPAAQVVVKGPEELAQRIDADGTASQIGSADEIREILSALASPTDADAAVVNGYVLVPRQEFDAFYKEAVSLSRLCDYREREAFIIAQGAFDRTLTAAMAGEDGR